jgi:hypothetical protein
MESTHIMHIMTFAYRSNLLFIFWVVRIGPISDIPIYPLSYGQSRNIRVVKKEGLLSDKIISGMYCTLKQRQPCLHRHSRYEYVLYKCL